MTGCQLGVAKARQKELVKVEAEKDAVIEDTLKEHEKLLKKLAKI